jgi:FkbM family methyltransferase
MSVKRVAFRIGVKAVKSIASLLGESRKTLIMSELVEELTPIVNSVTPYGEIKFFCPGRIPHWRAETLLTKEPETIQWIDGFDPNSVFWDVGANVGVYSLYAAQRHKLQVMAFEPSAANYYILSKNIEINDMDSLISGFCIAFSDTSELGFLNMSNTTPGGALSCFGEAQETYHICGKTFDVPFKQAMTGFTIDEFIDKFSPPFPNYLKVDVDSIEDKIIVGAANTIKDHQLKSVLIELDTKEEEYSERVITSLEEAGLKLTLDRHDRTYDYGDFASIYNHIFVRE